MTPIIHHTLLLFQQHIPQLWPAKAPGFSYAWLELISHQVLVTPIIHHTLLLFQQHIPHLTTNKVSRIFLYLAGADLSLRVDDSYNPPYFASFQQHIPHLTTSKSSRIFLCLAGADLSPSVHWAYVGTDSATKGKYG